MFKSMKNIDSAFRHVRMFTLVVIVGSLCLSGFALYKSYQLVGNMQSKVYILANGKALEAYASDRKDNIIVEAKDHVKAFHQNFFTLDPDEKVIQTNITKALYLADASLHLTTIAVLLLIAQMPVTTILKPLLRILLLSSS